MGLPRKLQKWVDHGLISGDQRDRILNHEQNRSGNLLKHSIGYVGMFSILLGFTLIIAANWQDISDTLKIGAHIVANLVLTALVFMWRDNPQRQMHREGALFALWGLTMTLIALIGQVYQLSGDTFSAVRLWFWITTPMILYFARGFYLTSLWAIFFVIYVPFEAFTYVMKHVESDTLKLSIGMLMGTILPIGLFVLGSWPKIAGLRPAMAKTFRSLGLIGGAVISSVAGLVFYGWNGAFLDVGQLGTLRATAALSLLAIIGIGFALRRTRILDPQGQILADIICLAGAMTAIPHLVLYGSDIMAMLHFIFLWLGIGYLAQTGGFDRLVNLAILLVTIRLFIGFLELFGSMMMSGLGFIVIGLVLMALLYGARIVKRKILPVQTA